MHLFVLSKEFVLLSRNSETLVEKDNANNGRKHQREKEMKTQEQTVNVQGNVSNKQAEGEKRERQRNTVIQMCTRARETPDFYRKRAHTHTPRQTDIVGQSDSINLQSVDDLHGNVIRIQSTDISDVTTFSIVINDVFDASIIVVIIVEDVEAFFVICGKPLIAVHVRQEMQIEVGIDSSKKLHVIIIQTDPIAEMLIADVQCCKEKKQD